MSNDTIFKSLEIKNNKKKLTKSLSKQFSTRKSVAKPLTEILGENAEEIAKIRLFDAPQFFEKKEEKKQIEMALTSVFQICKPINKTDWLVYGMEPMQFDNTTLNPLRRYNMQNAVDASEEKNPKDKSYCCGKKKKEEEIPEEQENKWVEMIIINHEGRFWINFQFFVSVLCLVSSYYYCSIVCFRYSNTDHIERVYLIASFESIFFIHIVLKFLVDYKVEGSKRAVRDLQEIRMNYFNNGFVEDVILLLPL